MNGLLASSGLHLVEVFQETPWGPWHCICHEVATDNFSAAEIGLTWASSMGLQLTLPSLLPSAVTSWL